MKHHDAPEHLSVAFRVEPKTAFAIAPVLTQRDREEMARHLMDPRVRRDPVLTHVMKHKLATARWPTVNLDGRAVAGGCVVTCRVGDGPERVGLLCHRTRTDSLGVVPVRSLLGATLIGMSVGQSAPLILPDRSIERVRVLAVAGPSGASRAPRAGEYSKRVAEDGRIAMEFPE